MSATDNTPLAPRATLDDIVAKLDSLKKPPKDVWDKLQTISIFFSSFLLAAASMVFTTNYNNRQLEMAKAQNDRDAEQKTNANRIAALQAVEKFMPYLYDKDEDKKQAALLVLDTLGQSVFVTRYAQLNPTRGAKAAGDQIMARTITPGQGSNPPVVVDPSASAGTARPRAGWVYVGAFESGTWTTRYLSIDTHDDPANIRGRTLKVNSSTGSLLLRASMPGSDARFGQVIETLTPNTAVHVKTVTPWSTTGYIWAEVEVVP